MARFEKRLLKLEARLIGRSGLISHSPQRLAYWISKLEKVRTGEEPGEPGCIPMEAWDAIAVRRSAELDRGGPAEIAADNGG